MAGEGEGERTIAIAVGPIAVARAVLPRVLGALARRMEFSSEGIGEVQLLADGLARNAGDWIGASQLGLTVEFAPRQMELHVGPLRAGGATTVLDAAVAANGTGLLVERLPGDPDAACGEAAEMLALRVTERG